MALKTFKCNHLTSLHFKELSAVACVWNILCLSLCVVVLWFDCVLVLVGQAGQVRHGQAEDPRFPWKPQINRAVQVHSWRERRDRSELHPHTQRQHTTFFSSNLIWPFNHVLKYFWCILVLYRSGFCSTFSLAGWTFHISWPVCRLCVCGCVSGC